MNDDLGNEINVAAIIEEIINKLSYNSLLCLDDYLRVSLKNNRYSDSELEIITRKIIRTIKYENSEYLIQTLFIPNGINRGKVYISDSSVEIQVLEDVVSFVKNSFALPLTNSIIDQNNNAKKQQKAFQMNKIEGIKITHGDVAREAENLYYRGHSDVSYELIPSLLREKTWEEHESKLYHDLISRFPVTFENKKRHIDILQEMQHYSMPTRLLDVTQSPLTALFFAVVDAPDSDGEVIIFHPDESIQKNSYSDSVELLCSLAALPYKVQRDLFDDITDVQKLTKSNKINNNSSISNERVIKKFSKKNSVKKLLHEIRSVVGDFDSVIIPNDLNGIRFVLPRQDNDRIVRQNGSFIVTGLFELEEDRKKKVIEAYNQYRIRRNGKIIRFLIPAKSKQNILNQLKILGINESTIYPEMDNVSRYLRSNIKDTRRN